MGFMKAAICKKSLEINLKRIELEKGMSVFGQTEDNQTIQAIIKDFSATHVMVDYNHPLAGKTLAFRFKVLGFREVSEEEILASHHGGGTGCCGGHRGSWRKERWGLWLLMFAWVVRYRSI